MRRQWSEFFHSVYHHYNLNYKLQIVEIFEKPFHELRYVDAIKETLFQLMQKDKKIIMMGQDIAEYGGVFKVSEDFYKKFDLVMANIFSGELISMSSEISRVVSTRGLVILSGLLFYQEAGVLSAYRRHGFYLVRRIRIGDWSTLVVSRSGINHKKAN